MSRQDVRVKSDHEVFFYDTHNKLTQTIIDTSNGATCTFLPTSPDVDQTLTVAAAEDDDVLNVSTVGKFVVGDYIALAVDGRDANNQTQVWPSTVIDVDEPNGQLTISDAIATPVDPQGASIGNRIVKVFTTTPISMTYFNSVSPATPAVGTTDYGWQGTLPFTAPLSGGQKIDFEITLMGDESGGLNYFTRICGIGKDECDDG